MLALVIAAALVLLFLVPFPRPFPLVEHHPIAIEGADGTLAERALQASPELEMVASGVAQPVLVQDAPGISASVLARSQLLADTASDVHAMILVEHSPTLRSHGLAESDGLWSATSAIAPMLLVEHGSGIFSTALGRSFELGDVINVAPSILIEHGAGTIGGLLSEFPVATASATGVGLAIVFEHTSGVFVVHLAPASDTEPDKNGH